LPLGAGERWMRRTGPGPLLLWGGVPGRRQQEGAEQPRAVANGDPHLPALTHTLLVRRGGGRGSCVVYVGISVRSIRRALRCPRAPCSRPSGRALRRPSSEATSRRQRRCCRCGVERCPAPGTLSHHPRLQETRGWRTETVDLSASTAPVPLFPLYPPAMRAAYIALVREARLLQRHWLRKPPAGIPNVALLLERWLRIRDGSAAGGAAAEGDGGQPSATSARGAAARGPWAGEMTPSTTSPALPVARASSGNSRRAVRVGAQLPLPAMDSVAFAEEASLEGPGVRLNSYMRGMLTLSTQPHTRFLGTRATCRRTTRRTCSVHAAASSPGTKNRFFTSRADPMDVPLLRLWLSRPA